MHLWEISLLTVTSGECSLSCPDNAILKVVQYLSWNSMFGLSSPSISTFLCTYYFKFVSVFCFLNLSGGDFLKVDVVAATVDLVLLHVPVLQLKTQLPHHTLKIPISTVHLDVVLLQLLLVANYLCEAGGR